MKINLLVEGGSMQPGPALSQKLGPTGINVGQVIQEVNKATQEFKGMKVPVELDIDTGTKNINVLVFPPPVSELIKKEVGIEKGSGEQKKSKAGNASIEQIISVAKTKLPSIISKDLKAAVKEVLGSCVSLGILVESKSPQEIIDEVNQGKYNKEIQEEKTNTDEEKRKKLDEDFENVKKEQEIRKKAEEEKAAEAASESTEETKETEESEVKSEAKPKEEKKETKKK